MPPRASGESDARLVLTVPGRASAIIVSQRALPARPVLPCLSASVAALLHAVAYPTPSSLASSLPYTKGNTGPSSDINRLKWHHAVGSRGLQVLGPCLRQNVAICCGLLCPSHGTARLRRVKYNLGSENRARPLSPCPSVSNHALRSPNVKFPHQASWATDTLADTYLQSLTNRRFCLLLPMLQLHILRIY